MSGMISGLLEARSARIFNARSEFGNFASKYCSVALHKAFSTSSIEELCGISVLILVTCFSGGLTAVDGHRFWRGVSGFLFTMGLHLAA